MDAYKLQVSSKGFNFVENSVASPAFGGDKLTSAAWHMVTVTSNGSKMTLYLDGQDVGNVAIAGGYDYFYPDSWCAYGNGGRIVFDDLKTFTSCLTTDQINEIYNREKPLSRKLTITQGVASPSVSETALECPSRGGTKTITLTLPTRTIEWTAEPLVDWIVPSQASGKGTADITLNILKNPETDDRTGVVMIDGETLYVPIDADDDDTHWVVEDYPDDWMYAIDEDGYGDTDLEIDISEMGQGVSLMSRLGAVTVSGQKFYVYQRDFNLSISPASVAARANSQNGTLTIETEDENDDFWEAVSDVDWITITAGWNRTGNGTLSYALAENTGEKGRVGRIIIAGEVCTITQACPAVVTGIDVVGADSVLAGESAAFAGRLLYSDGSAASGQAVAWNIVEGTGATIDAEGLLTVGMSEGTVVISASCQIGESTWTATKDITVLAKPTTLTVSAGQELICPGWTVEIGFTATYADGTTKAVSPNVTVAGDAAFDEDGFLTISLGSSGLAYSGGGDAAWAVDPWTSHDGTFSMKSGGLLPNQKSDLITSVECAGTISFWVKTSTANGTATTEFQFVVDGTVVAVVQGENDWTNIVYEICSYDSHELIWRCLCGGDSARSHSRHHIGCGNP